MSYEKTPNENIKDMGDFLDDSSEPMTTLIGIKCVDGIVIASDSQATFKIEKTKELGVTKIFIVNNLLALGGSGDAFNIKLLVEQLEKEFPKNAMNEEECREQIKNIILNLHKKYNIDQKAYLGEEAKELFHPTVILGGRLENNDFALYLIKENAMIYPIDDYQIIGQGASLARLVIKQINRNLSVVDMTLSKLGIEDAVKFSCYIINEVKGSDNATGGLTRVVVIDSNGVRELSEEEISKSYEDFVTIISFGFSRTLGNSDIPTEKLKDTLPKE